MAENNRNLFSHDSGGQISKIKASTAPCSLWRTQRRIHSLSLLACGGGWHSSACGQVTPMSATTFTTPSALLCGDDLLPVSSKDTYDWI